MEHRYRTDRTRPGNQVLTQSGVDENEQKPEKGLSSDKPDFFGRFDYVAPIAAWPLMFGSYISRIVSREIITGSWFGWNKIFVTFQKFVFMVVRWVREFSSVHHYSPE